MQGDRIHLVFCKGILETMDDFVDHLMKAADEMSVDYYLMDIRNPSTINTDVFTDFLQQGNVAAFLTNNIGLELKDELGDVWERYEVPVYDLIVDHPRYFRRYLKKPECDLRLVCLDREHIKFVNEFYPEIKKVYFMPNGGYEPGEPAIRYEDRPIDVLYTGDCQEQLPYPFIDFPGVQLFQDGGKDFYETVVAGMIMYPDLTTEEAIKRYLSQSNEVSREQYEYIIFDIAKHIECNVRRYFKLKAMHLLDDAGICVDVYGRNWVDVERPFSSNIRTHGRIDIKTCNELPSKARISLNFMPWFKDGCSERVFNNMLGGAVCVTDTSKYLNQVFHDGVELRFFRLDNLEEMVSIIQDLLNRPAMAYEISQRGKKAAENHTWKSRLTNIVDIISKDFQADKGQDQ